MKKSITTKTAAFLKKAVKQLQILSFPSGGVFCRIFLQMVFIRQRLLRALRLAAASDNDKPILHQSGRDCREEAARQVRLLQEGAQDRRVRRSVRLFG